MSCNGCRILRKGCNENCILRQSLHGIESPQSQSNATVFVAKFFGRAGLISFLSSVPESQRPALFQSLLFEACVRTVNPVSGAVGLLSTGNWHVCQSAVETVLRGGVPRSLPELSGLKFDEGSEANNDDLYGSRDLNTRLLKRKGFDSDETRGLDLGLTSGFPARLTARRRVNRSEKLRPDSPSDESETTTLESGSVCDRDSQQNNNGHESKLLRLFF
ncbi:hypothetical protein DH2020_029335 [Rehmannia glutinosa]|uniref:LOB domain-containing protein n=1 Tax=Rehmannia glutinosa TaxID=99300 RepID=A0ABR0VPS1_REHGL